MPNAFDTDGRGPSTRNLIVVGLSCVLSFGLFATTMVVKSKGTLDDSVDVTAQLTSVGDGLPLLSDVKFRGVLVGHVSGVIPASTDRPNTVSMALKPEFAQGIPANVTARVVPSNIFAVSSVQLIDNGSTSAALRSGAVIPQDSTLPTVLFQTTIDKFRQVLAAVGREPSDNVGILATVGQATEGRGASLLDAGRDLEKIVTQLNSIVGSRADATTITALNDAATGLRHAAPDLFDALGLAVRPMQTLAEKRVALTDLIAAGLTTTHTLADAFDHQTDRLITISTELAPVIGVLGDNSGQLHGMASRIQTVTDKLYGAWNPDTKVFVIKGAMSLTPTRSYIRQDCPRYGALAGPSCQTAPEVPTAPSLRSALQSRGYPLQDNLNENRPNVAPPRNSVPPPGAAGDVVAPPDPAAPAIPVLPAEKPDTATGSEIHSQSAVIGGNVGPVGSTQELDQLSRIMNRPADATTSLLLGPVVRGASVQIDPVAGDPK